MTLRGHRWALLSAMSAIACAPVTTPSADGGADGASIGADGSLDASSGDATSDEDAGEDAGADLDAAVPCIPACMTPPASTCVGDEMHGYDAIGACIAGTCEYESYVLECAHGCSDGACETECGGHDFVFEAVDATPFRAVWTSLAVDGDGVPQILTFASEATAEPHARHYTLAAGVWTGAATPTPPVGSRPVIALTADGTAHVARQVYVTDHYELSYARRTPAGTWEETDTRIGRGSTPSIAVSSSGVVHVMYAEADGLLRHARREGGTWTTEVVAGADSVSITDVVVGADGTVHVAVMQLISSISSTNLLYAERAPDGTWSVEGAETAFERGSDPSIAVDGAGTVHIAHTELNGDFAAYHTWRPVGGAWATERIGGTASAWDTRIALGPLDGVHVLYRNLYDLVHAERTDAGTWVNTIVRVNETSDDSLSFVIDSSGTGHIAYGTTPTHALLYGTRTFCR